MKRKSVANAVERVGLRVLLYFALAVGGLIVLLVSAYILTRAGVRSISGGWFGLVGFTPFVFWYVIKSQRQHWRRTALWVAVAGLLVLQLGVFVTILRRYPDFRMFWYAPASILEVALFAGVLATLFERRAA